MPQALAHNKRPSQTYARFVPRSDSEPSPVTGWYHFDHIPRHRYGDDLPPNEHLLAVTEEQWEAHFANPAGWAVVNGRHLVPYKRPSLPLHPKMQMMMTMREGVQIVSKNENLNGTYATGDDVWSAMTTEAHIVQDTVDWADTSGKHHTFSADEFAAFVAAIARWRSDWRKYTEGLTKEPPDKCLTL